MSKRALRTLDYLDHILQAIERIERYTATLDLAAFMLDELVQDGVIRNIEILGEAANNVTKTDPNFANKNSEIPWATIYTMRNRVSHAYFQVDLGVVWNTVQNDLPKLKRQVQTLVTELTS